MVDFNNLDALFDKISKDVQKSLNEEVSKKIIELQGKMVQNVVYDAYNPKQYKRTGDLKRNIISVPLGNELGINIINDTWHKEIFSGQYVYIPEIIETGEGYSIPDKYDYGYGKPRPFVQKTREEVKRSNIHVKSLKKSLENKGYDIK